MVKFIKRLWFLIGSLFYLIGIIGVNYLIGFWVFIILDNGLLKDIKWLDLAIYGVIAPIANIIIYELWRKTYVD